MKRKSLLYLTFSFLLPLYTAFVTHAQDYTQLPEFIKANSQWVLGSWWDVDDPNNGTGINFNTNPPTPLLQTGLTSAEASAALSDPETGALLFYSNAEKCWDRNYNVMPYGDSLEGSRSTNQGACIIPVLDSPGKFYLFTLQAYTFGSSDPSLYYSVVDMSLNGGLGDVVPGRKNILLDDGPLQESMVAVPGNNCDIWLLVHPYHDPEIRAYHITREGIDTIPVISNTGPSLAATTAAYELGGMAISPDRSKIAITSYSALCSILGLIPSLGGILVGSFDASSGQVSGAVYINDSTLLYDPCFSPDNSKLYAFGTKADAAGGTSGTIELVQYDVSVLTPAALTAGRQAISSTPATGNDEVIKGIRRRKDILLLSDMSYITAPNLSGTACGLQAGPFIVLDSIVSNLNLGDDVVFPLPADTTYRTMLDTLICARETLVLDAVTGFQSYVWNDGSTAASRTISDTGCFWVLSIDKCHSRVDTFRIGLKAFVQVDLGNDTIVCSKPPLQLQPAVTPAAIYLWMDGSGNKTFRADSSGQYWLTASYNGCSDTDTIMVSFRNAGQDLGPDTAFCKGTPVQLLLRADAPLPASVLWSNGSKDNSYLITDTGTYWILVENPPCTGSDTIVVSRQICACFLEAPTAFSPNGDGLNDLFTPVIEAGCPIKQYTLSIYNRFGQRVFNSASTGKGWDGTYEGQAAEVGVYYYQVSFRGGTQQKEMYKKGDITLVR
jgi:gliding motility-associated-like protein